MYVILSSWEILLHTKLTLQFCASCKSYFFAFILKTYILLVYVVLNRLYTLKKKNSAKLQLIPTLAVNIFKNFLYSNVLQMNKAFCTVLFLNAFECTFLLFKYFLLLCHYSFQMTVYSLGMTLYWSVDYHLPQNQVRLLITETCM